MRIAPLCPVVLVLLLLSGCGDADAPAQRPSPTKAQWRQKVRPYYNPGGPVKVTTVTGFKALMGEPSQTQTDGDTGRAYWFYECADGTIEVELIDPQMTGGTMQIISITDF